MPNQDLDNDKTTRFVTLKILAERLDADRSTVRRWLKDANIDAFAMADGPRSAIRYRVADIERWIEDRPAV